MSGRGTGFYTEDRSRFIEAARCFTLTVICAAVFSMVAVAGGSGGAVLGFAPGYAISYWPTRNSPEPRNEWFWPWLENERVKAGIVAAAALCMIGNFLAWTFGASEIPPDWGLWPLAAGLLCGSFDAALVSKTPPKTFRGVLAGAIHVSIEEWRASQAAASHEPRKTDENDYGGRRDPENHG